MKISLDTKEDSAEDIHKIVRMLQAWLEGHVNAPADMFGNPSPGPASSSTSPEGGLFNMFGDSSSSPSSGSAQNPESSLADLKKDTDNDEIPEIIPY